MHLCGAQRNRQNAWRNQGVDILVGLGEFLIFVISRKYEYEYEYECTCVSALILFRKVHRQSVGSLEFIMSNTINKYGILQQRGPYVETYFKYIAVPLHHSPQHAYQAIRKSD